MKGDECPKDSLNSCKSVVRFGFSTLKSFSNLLIQSSHFHPQECDDPHDFHSFGMGCSTSCSNISHISWAILRGATTLHIHQNVGRNVCVLTCAFKPPFVLLVWHKPAFGFGGRSSVPAGWPLASDNVRLHEMELIHNQAQRWDTTWITLRMRIGPTIISCCLYKGEQPPKINAVFRCCKQQSILVH